MLCIRDGNVSSADASHEDFEDEELFGGGAAAAAARSAAVFFWHGRHGQGFAAQALLGVVFENVVWRAYFLRLCKDFAHCSKRGRLFRRWIFADKFFACASMAAKLGGLAAALARLRRAHRLVFFESAAIKHPPARMVQPRATDSKLTAAALS